MQTFNATHSSRIPAAVALRGAANLPQSPQASDGGMRRSFDRGDEIFIEGEACSTFYKVLSGTVRTGKLLSDGRRKIDAFHLVERFEHRAHEGDVAAGTHGEVVIHQPSTEQRRARNAG